MGHVKSSGTHTSVSSVASPVQTTHSAAPVCLWWGQELLSGISRRWGVQISLRLWSPDHDGYDSDPNRKHEACWSCVWFFPSSRPNCSRVQNRPFCVNLLDQDCGKRSCRGVVGYGSVGEDLMSPTSCL